MKKQLPITWAISGSDSGSGAGLQADLRAFDAMGVHGCTAVAALTAQNSVAVCAVQAVSAAMLGAQLDALASDMAPQAIKTGMLGSAENLRQVAQRVDGLRQQRPALALVVDPVLRSSTHTALADEALLDAYRTALLPRTTLLTPNRLEAALLLGCQPLRHKAQVEKAAQDLLALGCQAVVITGGDDSGQVSEDYALTAQASAWLSLPRVVTKHNHGTGCVFASTAAAALARGFVTMEAVVLAKMATSHALRRGYAAGQGAGPVLPGSDFAQHSINLPFLDALDEQLPFAPLIRRELGLYAVVDSAAWVQRVLDAGVRTVQLRIKSEVADAQVREHIRLAVVAARAADAQLFINDHWQLAIAEGAYGVHLGQEDLTQADLAAIAQAGLRLGVSTHAYWEVCRAWALRPSYIACGPIYPTYAKAMPWKPQGNENLTYWCNLLPTPVVAIGGMNVWRTQQAAACGAAGVAAISAITAASEPSVAIAELQLAIARGWAMTPCAAPLLAQATL